MRCLHLPWTAALVVPSILAAGAAATEAPAAAATPAGATRFQPRATVQSHDVPPALRLVVSLEYRGDARGPRTLVRFTRNRLALVRRADRRLAIDAARARSLTPLPPKHRVRVRLVLDVDGGQVIARAGRRRVRVARRLMAEHRVVVRGRGCCVRRLKIHASQPTSSPASAVPAPAQPAGGAAGTVPAVVGDATAPATSVPAAPSPPSSTSALFARGVWGERLAVDAPLDPAGPVLTKTLQDMVAEDLASGRGPWIATNESSTPVYRVSADQPLVRVQVDTGSWGLGLQQAFEAVPVPDDARPARGPDGHMTVWQPSTDRFWEFFHMRRLSDGWHADFGGAMQNVSTTPGYYDKTSWPGISDSHWGASATSLPVAAGLMTIDELRAGEIRHALSLVIPWASSRTFSWPAQRTDGASADPDAIPEGARFRLDPTLDLTQLNLPRMTLLMAQAAQRYGMIVVDQTGWAVGFRAEDPTPTGSDPYYGAGGLFGGLWPSQVLARFPWQHLQLLAMRLSGG